MTRNQRNATDGREGAPTTPTGTDDGPGDRHTDRPVPDGGPDPSVFEALVARAEDGFGVADASGTLTDVNDAFAALLDRPAEDLVGCRLSDVVPGIDGETAGGEWTNLADGESASTEAVLDRDGDDVHVAVTVTAVDVDGSRSVACRIADVSDRVRAEAERQRQEERLEQFASVVSHDLRNPLNVAMGRIQLLEEDCDSDHIGPVDRSLQRMEALIADVLDLAREGSRPSDPEPVELRAAAHNAWSTTATTEATLDVADGVGAVASTESRTATLFEHLFENAVVHGREDVTVRVGPLSDGFYVADDGPGIPADEREEVFELGYTTSEDGTGFGLAVVRDVATAHGWAVELTESEDGGARFAFRDVAVE